LGGAVW